MRVEACKSLPFPHKKRSALHPLASTINSSLARLPKQDHTHREAAVLKALVGIAHRVALGGAPQAIKQRHVMFERGMRQRRQWLAPVLGCSKRRKVAGFDRLLHIRVEFDGPGKRRGVLLLLHPTQIVHDVAASQNQHAAVTQPGKLASEFDVARQAAARVEADLKHRDVRFRIKVPQDAPRPVIEPPRLVRLDFKFAGDAFGLGRRARRRILDLIEWSREAVEVMNGARLGHGQNLGAARHPMRRNHAYRLGTRQLLGEPRERLRKPVPLDGIHRRSVADEKNGHFHNTFRSTPPFFHARRATFALVGAKVITPFFRSASIVSESPGTTSPSSNFMASGSWMSRWMARFSGRAPNWGSYPSRKSSS